MTLPDLVGFRRVLMLAGLLAAAVLLNGCARGVQQGRALPKPSLSARALSPPPKASRTPPTARKAGMIWPLPEPHREIISGFGNRGRGLHQGVDIRAPMQTNAYAAADGVVSFSGDMRGYGRVVMVHHPNGLETRYAHLHQCRVVKGQKVRQGDVVGLTGRSGNASTPHLHYEVRIPGRCLDPADYLP